MTFNSLNFIAFLILSLLAVHLSPRRWHSLVLTVFSWYFYAFWSAKYLLLILGSTLLDYGVALAIARSSKTAHRTFFLLISLIGNLGLLGFFKYYTFFTDTLVGAGAFFAVDLHPPIFELLLPVGISFYTFQTMSYTIDVHRGRLEPTTKFFDYAAYVAFFPQLVAGPIERASVLLPQISQPRCVRRVHIEAAVVLIAWGMFKKIVIADNLAPYVELAFDSQPEILGAGGVVVGMYAFAIQIYCDFSGYTDIARGVALLFGIELMLNFNLLYFARSIGDFWKRWHISLSTWLRDYLYISLGGNRKGRWRTFFNLQVTMFLGGLWHGASWMFIIWGGYQGILLCLERAFGKKSTPFVTKSCWCYSVLRRLFVFHLICFGWVLFRCHDLQHFYRWWELLATMRWGGSLSDGTLSFPTLYTFVFSLVNTMASEGL